MEARSLTRSACTVPARASAHTAPAASRLATSPDVLKKEEIKADTMSERRNIQEETLQPAHGLHFIHDAFAAEFDTRVSHLSGQHGVRTCDRTGVDHTRETNVLAAPVNGHLFIAGNLQIAVGQHTDHCRGERARERIVGTTGALALGLVVAGHIEIL